MNLRELPVEFAPQTDNFQNHKLDQFLPSACPLSHSTAG